MGARHLALPPVLRLLSRAGAGAGKRRARRGRRAGALPAAGTEARHEDSRAPHGAGVRLVPDVAGVAHDLRGIRRERAVSDGGADQAEVRVLDRAGRRRPVPDHRARAARGGDPMEGLIGFSVSIVALLVFLATGTPVAVATGLLDILGVYLYLPPAAIVQLGN